MGTSVKLKVNQTSLFVLNISFMHKKIDFSIFVFKVDPVGTSEEEPHVSKFFLRHYLLLLNKIEFLDLRFTVYQVFVCFCF